MVTEPAFDDGDGDVLLNQVACQDALSMHMSMPVVVRLRRDESGGRKRRNGEREFEARHYEMGERRIDSDGGRANRCGEARKRGCGDGRMN